MSHEVAYCQINKDYTYWVEKRRLGQMEGGHVCGLLTHLEEGEVRQNILIDAGLGTLTGLVDTQEELVESGFLHLLQLEFAPEQQKFGAYLVHYSGWEDPWGMLTDEQLSDKFITAYPDLSSVVRIAERGQTWRFHF